MSLQSSSATLLGLRTLTRRKSQQTVKTRRALRECIAALDKWQRERFERKMHGADVPCTCRHLQSKDPDDLPKCICEASA